MGLATAGPSGRIPFAHMAEPFTPPLASYLTKSVTSYTTCLDSIGSPEAVAANATVRFHHLKIHPVTGEPMFKELAEMLADQLVEYCYSAKRTSEPTTSAERQKLHREARDLLTRKQKSGEAGEMLVYFLIEAILGAPQLIAKMELKTNTKLESFGADGVHVKWSEPDQILEIYCAESKLEGQPSKAISNCVASLQEFHLKDSSRHELRLATSHFKHADVRTKEAITRILENKEPSIKWRLRHACLVGYNSKNYGDLTGTTLAAMEAEFKGKYLKNREQLLKLVTNHFGKVKNPLITFEVFILPFRTVQEYRDAFIAAL